MTNTIISDWPLFSIIIPVYNVQEYIDECLESVCGQTYRNIEILLVDDGSYDESSAICDGWKSKDSRIRVFHKKNGGLSDARNFGIARANGSYLSFVDSDDWVEADFIERLYRALTSSSKRIASCGVAHHFGKRTIEKCCNGDGTYDSREATREILLEGNIDVAVTNKIFDKTIFDNIVFPVGMISEDAYIIFSLLNIGDGCACIKRPLYHYRHRESSITTGLFSENRLSVVDVIKQNRAYLVKTYGEEIVPEVNRYSIKQLSNLIGCAETSDGGIRYARILNNYYRILKLNWISDSYLTVREKIIICLQKTYLFPLAKRLAYYIRRY